MKSLQNQSFYPLALLLSVATHLCLGLSFGNSKQIEGGSVSAKQKAAMTIVVQLALPESATQPIAPALPSLKEVHGNRPLPQTTPAGPSKSATELTQSLDPTPHIAVQTPDEEPSILPVLKMPEPRYFQTRELTEQPSLLQDIAPDMITVLPDISPQPALVQLLINEQGDIDKVVIEESSLSEQAKRFVIDSFAKVRFHPGKLGDLPVKSQLNIEVTLENAKSAVVPTVVSIVR